MCVASTEVQSMATEKHVPKCQVPQADAGRDPYLLTYLPDIPEKATPSPSPILLNTILHASNVALTASAGQPECWDSATPTWSC